MVTAGIFLLGCEQADPSLHLGRKPSGTRQRNRWLDPSIVSHRKRFHSLSTCAIRRAGAIASVCEQDRADGGSVRAITISVWIGINDREHISMLVCYVCIISAASLRAPIHSMGSGWSWNKGHNSVCCSVNNRHMIGRVCRWAVDIGEREHRRGRPFFVGAHRRLDRTLERMKDVQTGLAVGGERDGDIPQDYSGIDIDHGNLTAYQISHVSLVNSMDMAFPDSYGH